MEHTASSSSRVSLLLDDLRYIEDWMYIVRDSILDKVEIRWSESHIEVVIRYVSKFKDIDYKSWENLLMLDQTHKEVAQTAVLFVQDLHYLFEIPRIEQQRIDNDETAVLMRKGLLASFISFLDELLCNSMRIQFFEDGIDILQKQLRFIFTILGDESFLRAEAEQVWNILAEFEVVANDAGDLVHSIIFVSDVDGPKFTMIVKALDMLLIRINHFSENFVRFSNKLPFTINAAMPPKSVFGDSLWINDSFVHDLEDLMNNNGNLAIVLKIQVETLHRELLLSQSMLNRIKASSIHSEILQLEESATHLRDVIFEAEYLINSFLVGNVPQWYLTIRLPAFIHKIKHIGAELQQIMKKCDVGALKVAEGGAPISPPVKRTPEVDGVVVGFDDNARDILEKLVGGREQLQMISVVGMPGLGKTTFAKKLYNNPSVTYRFDNLSWCVVSQTYHRKNLLADVLMNLPSKFDKVDILEMEEDSLVRHIYKSLKGRRYLIVIDDIWDSNAWADLRICFPDDRNGSRIILTTRNKDAAPPGSIIYKLPFLSNEQCWELLENKVFGSKPCPYDLRGIGKEIAANCSGLPIAVVVVAGILSALDKEVSVWKEVGGKLGSYIFNGGDNYMMSIAELSYNHLSECLKPCFLYFGVFPEDTTIYAKELKRMWIAEGFIRKEDEKSAASVAEEYLMELIDKSLVIVGERRSNGGVKTCVIHDLLLELCLKLSKGKSYTKWADNRYPVNEEDHRLLNLKFFRVLDTERMFRFGSIGLHWMVNLKYLIIDFMPASVHCLVNLEFLQVNSGIVKLGRILKLSKLRSVHVSRGARYDEDVHISQVNRLEFLSRLEIFSLKDEEMLRSTSPHLRSLKCECELLWDKRKRTYRYPDLRFLTHLESLTMINLSSVKRARINFPSTIRKLNLTSVCLPWKRMSIIGVLPNLVVLKLRWCALVGDVWETRDGEFQQLRYLKLDGLDLKEWKVASTEHFPRLQRLTVRSCSDLKEIPNEIGHIGTLQSIEVYDCREEVAESARRIEEEQWGNGNEEFKFVIR